MAITGPFIYMDVSIPLDGGGVVRKVVRYDDMIGGHGKIALHKVIESEAWPIPIHPRPRRRQERPWNRQGHGSISVLLPPYLHMNHNETPPLVGAKIQMVVAPALEVDHMRSGSMGYTVSQFNWVLTPD